MIFIARMLDFWIVSITMERKRRMIMTMLILTITVVQVCSTRMKCH
jgi:hypothetical membrane protein